MVEVPTLPLRSFFILMFATCIAVSVNDVASFQARFSDIDRVHPENTGIMFMCVCVVGSKSKMFGFFAEYHSTCVANIASAYDTRTSKCMNSSTINHLVCKPDLLPI